MKEFLKKNAMVNIIIFIIALVMIGVGIGLGLGSGGVNRQDIKLYNKAVSVYNEVDVIPADPEGLRPPDFPIENLVEAVSYFQQAASKSTDNRLISIALYNLGTVIGRDYLLFTNLTGRFDIAFEKERIPGLGLGEAIAKLAEAVRIDPSNDDAKYNLEVLEKARATAQQQASSVTSSSGAVASAADNYTGY